MVAETESLLLGTSSKITAVKPVASNQARGYISSLSGPALLHFLNSYSTKRVICLITLFVIKGLFSSKATWIEN